MNKKIFNVFLLILIANTTIVSVSAMQDVYEGPVSSRTRSKMHGIDKTTDKTGTTVYLEWYKIIDEYDIFFNLIKQLLPVQAEAFVDVTRNFLDENFSIKSEYEEIVKKALSKEDPNKNNAWSLRPNIEIAKIENRKRRVEVMLQAFEQDLKNGKYENLFRCSPILVMAKNEENKILGFAFYLLHPELIPKLKSLAGVVWLDVLAVLPEAQGHGLAKLLFQKVLKLIPDIKCVACETRIWNTKAQAVYESLGCKRIEGFSPTGVGFEYFVKK
ncbi:MAG: GNAT family N-acetyltransferase [Candidatus Babeliales bacterium]